MGKAKQVFYCAAVAVAAGALALSTGSAAAGRAALNRPADAAAQIHFDMLYRSTPTACSPCKEISTPLEPKTGRSIAKASEIDPA